MTFLSEAAAKLVGKAEEELSQRARELLARILLPDEITGAVAERYVKKALRTGAWRDLRPESRALLMVSRAWKVIRSKFVKEILFSLFSGNRAPHSQGKGPVLREIHIAQEGKADALKSALDHVDTENIVVMDGDYTYPADYVCSLVEALDQGHDLAIGVRKNAEKGSQGLIYRFGKWVLTSFFNALFGTRLSDVLSGMYAVKREVLEEMFFESRGFGIESEIAAHVASSGGSIAEVPISYRKRVGEKKLKSIHGLGIAATMLRLSWRYNPVFFIFILGSLIAIPGLILGAYVAYNLLFLGINYYFKGLVAIFLTLAGIQLFVAALISLYMKRIELRIIKAVRRRSS